VAYAADHGLQIGRIQEFVGSDSARVAFFLRPRDIGSGAAKLGRRLLATMHSDVVPLSFLRAKCRVVHKNRIPKKQEEAYRREPDSFYYNQVGRFLGPIGRGTPVFAAVRPVSAPLL
jgi:hypothetical protein